MGWWSDSDTSRETGDSGSKVARASHDARDDATKDGIFERGNNAKNRERFSRDSESGKEAGGFWSSIFGRK